MFKILMFRKMIKSIALLSAALSPNLLWAQAAGMDDLRIVEIPNVQFGQEFSIDVLSSDRSMYLSGRSVSTGTELLIDRITDPSGKVIYSAVVNGDNINVTGNVSKDALANLADFAVLLPSNNHPESQLKAGEYKVRVISNGGDTRAMDVRAVFKQHVNGSQAVDVNILVLDRSANTRQRSLSESFKSGLSGEINRLMRPHQLRLGKLNIQEADQALLANFADTHEDEIPALCQQLSQRFGAGRALNIGLVETISSSEVQGIAGVSPGLPATVMHENYRNSCVLMSERAYGADIAGHAANLVHEMSHLMSIPHTTEESGQKHDSFSDTLECALRDFDGRSNLGVDGRAGDQAVDDFECGRDGGANNYMFYSGVADFMPFNMSEQQATVLKAHPLFYPVASANASASWYNPEQSGHGLSVEVLDDGRAVIYWYTFDQAGAPLWIVGTGNVVGPLIETQAITVSGGEFGAAFDANKVSRSNWGTLDLALDPEDCRRATLSWNSSAMGSGSMPMTRLSNLAEVSCKN
ncbi:hypothetical protein [uncultured Pseudoteredinibacter sp.]|uniref:hypothetical protein n=1 Tax=uncultured Pseudoteredinibacter sp. TaxID=1641701 RepID=UPI00263385B3|nr:hypothetical protein [uncultured Pseudoteredinibacter sp.]